MLKSEVKKIFGSFYKAAKALGIRPHSIYEWPDGRNIPQLREFQINNILREQKSQEVRQKLHAA